MIKIFGRYNIKSFEQSTERFDEFVILDYTCNLQVLQVNHRIVTNRVSIDAKRIHYIDPESYYYDIEIVPSDYVVGITFLNVDDRNSVKYIRSDGVIFETDIDHVIPVLIYDFHMKKNQDANITSH